MDSLTTSLDFDQSFPINWRAELANQNSLFDLDESTNLNVSQSIRMDQNSPEITTHYIKQYKDQLEGLQKDNFSLKLQIFYFQRAFENAGLIEFPQSSEYKEGFAELEKEFTDNKKLLSDANFSISQLTDQNKELQKRLSKLEKRTIEGRDKFDELTLQLRQKEEEVDDLDENYREISHQNVQLEQKCKDMISHISSLENEIAFLNAKSVAETENNLCDAQKLAEAEENARFYQEKNAQVLEFAKPLAQKLQETQEHSELSEKKCEKLQNELKTFENTGNVLAEKCTVLERELLNSTNNNDILNKQKDEMKIRNQELEQQNFNVKSKNSQLSGKIGDYEKILDSLHKKIKENAELLALQQEELTMKNREIRDKSHLEESLIQAKSIISKLENQLQEQSREIVTLKASNKECDLIEELNALKQKNMQTESKLVESENNSAKLMEQNTLLQNELENYEMLKRHNSMLNDEINSIKSVKKCDSSCQTKLTSYEVDQKEQTIFNLQQKIDSLVMEKDNLIYKQQELNSSHSELRNLTHFNEELKEEIAQVKEDLQLSNLRILELEEQLKLVGTLSKSDVNSENSNMTIDSENIQSILTELVDQLSETRNSLDISVTNENRLKTKLKDLQDKYAIISSENGRILTKLNVAEDENCEISQELERIRASYGNKLNSANQHLKELQHVFLPSPSKSKKKESIDDQVNSLPCELLNSRVITRADDPECKQTSDISTSVPESDIHSDAASNGNTDFDITLPDNELLRKAMSSDSKNVSLLLSIYKELLTTHKYLSRAKQYTLASQP